MTQYIFNLVDGDYDDNGAQKENSVNKTKKQISVNVVKNMACVFFIIGAEKECQKTEWMANGSQNWLDHFILLLLLFVCRCVYLKKVKSIQNFEWDHSCLYVRRSVFAVWSIYELCTNSVMQCKCLRSVYLPCAKTQHAHNVVPVDDIVVFVVSSDKVDRRAFSIQTEWLCRFVCYCQAVWHSTHIHTFPKASNVFWFCHSLSFALACVCLCVLIK